MNSAKGVQVEEELEILHQAGYTKKPGFKQHPRNEYGPDAVTDEDGYIEVRGKNCSFERANKSMNGTDPAGVAINVGMVRRHEKEYGGNPFVFLLRTEGNRIHRTKIDPKNTKHFKEGQGRDTQNTGKQRVYLIPTDLFEEIDENELL